MSSSPAQVQQPTRAAPRSDLRALLDAFRGVRALVLGEAILESFLSGPGRRLSGEAPVPIVDVTARTDVPGGAANTAANVKAVGGQVTLLSLIGDDLEGTLLKRALEARGIRTDTLLTQRGRRTLAKHRLEASGQMVARFDQGTTDPLPPMVEASFIEQLTRRWTDADVVIVSDYRYGVLTHGLRQALAELRREQDRRLVVDARDLMAYSEARPTAAKSNYEEAAGLLSLPTVDDTDARVEQIQGRGDELLEMSRASVAVITLDADGALVFERGRPPYRTYARPVQSSRPAKAGDTFVSVLGLGLAAGGTTQAAADLASAASAIVVGQEGATTSSAIELKEYLSAAGKYVSGSAGLRELAESLHRQGKRIVFAGGFFDILHPGHVTHFKQAKTLGDVLVVGVNTDESARRLKGPGRPINSLEDRVEILAALDSIDYLVPFGGDTPMDLIAALRPHVYAKGSDHSKDQLPEVSVVERLAGEVAILPLVTDFSTTAILQRIKERG